jgi:hypothetical protein
MARDLEAKSTPASSAGEPALLFCPFCRECFEAEARCPDHDLPLVPFDRLPPSAVEGQQEDDAPVGMLEWRRGRAELLVAGLALLASFVLPWVEVRAAGLVQEFTALSAAAQRVPNLWAVPVAGAFFVSLVLRRRTPLQMRAARVAALVAAAAPMISTVYSLRRVHQAAALEAGVEVAVRWGAWVTVGAALLGAVGALRFGGALRAHGSPPSSPEGGPAVR